MIQYTERLDKALRVAAWAHEQQRQHRKGGDIPYIIHPIGTMLIASNATSDEDVLIACLMHDILEDVDSKFYDEAAMRKDFGDRVASIVKDVTHDDTFTDWHERSRAYLDHLENQASDEAVIVSASDKIHNLQSTLIDYQTYGDDIWKRFRTKNAVDQFWWYESILDVIRKRNAPAVLCDILSREVATLKSKLAKS